MTRYIREVGLSPPSLDVIFRCYENFKLENYIVRLLILDRRLINIIIEI